MAGGMNKSILGPTSVPICGRAGLCARFDRLLRHFAVDRRGVIAILFALLLPVMVGMIGLGVEVAYWFQHKRNLQTVADSAAIAGAYEALSSSATAATIVTAATTDATRNGYDPTTDTITAVTPPTSGSYTADSSAVEVNLTRAVQTLFVGTFLGNSISIGARAVANSVLGGDEACVLALDTTAQNAINVSGTSSVSFDGCQIATNSSDDSSVNVANNADLTVDCISTVGGVDGSPTYSSCSGAKTGVNAITDPYAGLSVPDISADSCDYTGNGNNAYAASDGETISVPSGTDYAILCNGFKINAGTSVTFSAGTYIVTSGSFTINGGANVSGTDVTFIFTDSIGGNGNYADLSINGGGTVSLSAPTSGDYPGILFYQDQNAPGSNSDIFSFNGNSDTELTGTIYVPKNDVTFSGGNETDDNGCLQIVALTVTFNGNADIENQCAGSGVSSIYTSYIVSLVE